MIVRALAIICGLLILAAAAHATIVATGGYWTRQSYVTVAVAAGVGMAGILSGMAWSAGRRSLAVWLVVVIAAGEAFGFISTAERLIASREAAQGPLRVAEQHRAKDLERVRSAQNALDRLPTTSPRLEAALATKASADQAAIDKSPERGCRENCRAILQAQVNAAAAEIEQARVELGKSRTTAEGELTAARRALAALSVPPSPTPLADRLGVGAWLLDLVHSALGSLAANGLACGLLVFGAHQPNKRRAGRAENACERIAPELLATEQPVGAARPGDLTVHKRIISKQKHAAQFAVERLHPTEEGGSELTAIHRDYRDWCATKGIEPLPAAQIGLLLAELFDGAGLSIQERDGKLIAIGVALELQEPVTSLACSSPHIELIS
jgi:hypothetical protein